VGKIGYAYRFLIGKRERKRPLGRPRGRWEDSIRMNLREIECEGVDWICLAHDRVRWWAYVHTVMNLQVS
jgi:hypothetical protein